LEVSDNVVYGNRNYLMMLSQYHQALRNQESSDNLKRESDDMRKATLAYFSGDTHNMQRLLQSISGFGPSSRNESRQPLKDQLWAKLRAVSQRIMIHEALQAREEGDLSDFDTYYSELITEEELEQLKQIYRVPLDFSDMTNVFKEAFSKSHATSISEI
jgi:hypothetical protein